MKKSFFVIAVLLTAVLISSCGRPSPYREGYAHGRDFKAKWDKVQNPDDGEKMMDEIAIQDKYTSDYSKTGRKLPQDPAEAAKMRDMEKVKEFMRGWQDAIEGKEPAE